MSMRKHWGVFLLYLLLAISLLAPIASSRYAPAGQDWSTHIGLIAQASMAEKEGQFPVRTMPWEFHGVHPATYQFYGPSLYAVGGYLCSHLSPRNPYVIYKILATLSLLLGGFFIYRLSLKWTKSFPAAVLSGFSFMAAPYFLIDINARGALAETVALGVIPFVLYYTYALFSEKNFSIKYFILSSLMWYLLMTTHVVTFVNSSLFIGLFFLLLSGKKELTRLCRVGFAYVWACLMGAWFLVPLISKAPFLQIAQSGVASSKLLMSANIMTYFSKLLSITALSAVEQGIYGVSEIRLPFYPGIGWPMLMGLMVCVYYVYKKKVENTYVKKLLLLFALAFIATWSPVDFWQYLPQKLVISQYSYRFLAQIMWIGALLLGWALMLLINNENKERPISHVWMILLGIWVIGSSNASWLTAHYNASVYVGDIVPSPTMGYGNKDYLMNPSKIQSDELLMPSWSASKVTAYCHPIENGVACDLPSSFTQGIVQLPTAYYPDLLNIKVDGKRTSYSPTLPNEESVVLVGLPVSAGVHHITAQFVGCSWANKVSVIMVIMSSLLLLVLLFSHGLILLKKVKK